MGITAMHLNHTRQVLLLVGLIAASYWGVAIISGEHFQSYDAPTHLFFAKGYSDDWWRMWDPRWYGGYSRASYPPLAHQLIALANTATGDIRASYSLILWIFLSTFPLAVYQFSRSFVSEIGSLGAAIISIFLPSIREMAFVFGQFPGLVGMSFLLLTIGSVGSFIRSGKKSSGVASIAWVGCLAASHTNTLLLFLPFSLLALLPGLYMSETPKWDVFLKRVLVIGFGFAITATVVILPFWEWFQNYEMQQPITTPSRTNYLLDFRTLQLNFLDIHGPLLFLYPLLMLFGGFKRALLPLSLTSFLLLLLSLGGTTPLPAVLFGKDWQWLTYERFAFWASVSVLPLLGEFIFSAPNIYLQYAAKIIVATLIVGACVWLIAPGQHRVNQAAIDMTAVNGFLEQSPLCRSRYLALGFGFQLPDFSTYSGARTIDGEWHTARTDPLLRSSGISALGDSLSYADGEAVLTAVLQRISPVPAYCIFVNETQLELSTMYRRILKENGWRRNGLVGGEVSVWVKDNLVDIPMEDDSPQNRGFVGDSFIWGVFPLVCLLVGLIVSFTKLGSNR